jgi:hypothetical protein
MDPLPSKRSLSRPACSDDLHQFVKTHARPLSARPRTWSYARRFLPASGYPQVGGSRLPTARERWGFCCREIPRSARTRASFGWRLLVWSYRPVVVARLLDGIVSRSAAPRG